MEIDKERVRVRKGEREWSEREGGKEGRGNERNLGPHITGQVPSYHSIFYIFSLSFSRATPGNRLVYIYFSSVRCLFVCEFNPIYAKTKQLR